MTVTRSDEHDLLCSAHVPFFLDGRPFLKYRGELCWDGRFISPSYSNAADDVTQVVLFAFLNKGDLCSFPDFFYFENR